MPAFPNLRLCAALLLFGLATCAQAAPAFDAESPWMLSDFDGARTALSQQGYNFKLDYTGEMGNNLHGGSDRDRTARFGEGEDFNSFPRDSQNLTFCGSHATRPVRCTTSMTRPTYRFNTRNTALSSITAYTSPTG
jgi:carbohydrate-selective porin OprB